MLKSYSVRINVVRRACLAIRRCAGANELQNKLEEANVQATQRPGAIVTACVGLAALSLGTFSAIHPAKAGPISLSEGATDWMANGNAGESAKAYDAATVFANPAGMTLLQENEIDASLNGIFPSGTFSGEDRIGGQQLRPAGGGEGSQVSKRLPTN